MLATNLPETDRELTVVDTCDPANQVAKQFKGADYFAVDSGTQTLYVVRQGKLSIMNFDHPITRETERFEQYYQARQRSPQGRERPRAQADSFRR